MNDNAQRVKPTRNKVTHVLFVDVCQERDYSGYGLPVLQIPVDSGTTTEEVIAGMYLCLQRQPEMVEDVDGLRDVLDELRDHHREAGTMHMVFCPELTERNVMMKALRMRQMYAFFEIEEREEEARQESVPAATPEDEVEIPVKRTAAELMEEVDSWSGIPKRIKGGKA